MSIQLSPDLLKALFNTRHVYVRTSSISAITTMGWLDVATVGVDHASMTVHLPRPQVPSNPPFLPRDAVYIVSPEMSSKLLLWNNGPSYSADWSNLQSPVVEHTQ